MESTTVEGLERGIQNGEEPRNQDYQREELSVKTEVDGGEV